ncbi:unnamed protein product [Mytilus coruscus]|uniref:Uncharacterized protein n=1 Tax=Mytilus coruscus TaxID=42192 RepID=A0A6J8A191_MYTCO|nr:unnamed protein product [Mytilus coruscus]
MTLLPALNGKDDRVFNTLLCVVYGLIGVVVGFQCDENDVHCFTSLDIKSAFTMIGKEKDIGQVYAKDRALYSLNPERNGPVPIDDIITADGWNHTRHLITANESMPGPSIIIYENKKITILVKNHMINEAVTFHWHGIDQLGWPAMDGVAFVSQCPILPGQTFNYTFKPRFGGSYWYHSHVGNQRDMGMYGAFIVLRKRDPVPFELQHIVQIQEWNHLYNAMDLLYANVKQEVKFPNSILINGRGEFKDNLAPLEIFYVTKGIDDIQNSSETKLHFLNFGFPKGDSSINGRIFRWPTVSALTQPSEVGTECSGCTDEETCHCSHSINLKSGSEIIMVLLNLGTGAFISHPIHMHGHTFKVLKMEFPEVTIDGKFNFTEDIECSSTLPNMNSSCNNSRWRNSSWNDYKNIPGININDPVRKDTIVVPYGGYVIIRIEAKNPGVWFMHCHIDIHMVEGMALMLNESFEQSRLEIPNGLPTCHSYLTKMSGVVGSISTAQRSSSGISVKIKFPGRLFEKFATNIISI